VPRRADNLLNSMAVFVIIVSFNGSAWIRRCLSSLRSADCRLQTIIIDNGSTDGTQELIRSHYPEVELIQSERNLGFGKANNLGMKKAIEAGAEFVFLLNQDAYLWKGSVNNLVGLFNERRDAGIISPIHFAGDEQNLDFGFYKYASPTYAPGLLGSIINGDAERLFETKFVNAAAWIIKAEVIKQAGFFNPIFDHYGEDREYALRLQKHGYRLFIYPGLSIIHDRVQNREKNSYFIAGESYKRKLLIDVVSGKLSKHEANIKYSKVFIDKLIRFRFKHAVVTARNWRWLNRILNAQRVTNN
jgi:N-acetylglucosaminyl-diphospho-decaprenol L-rhamnosyltransferase